MSDLFNSDGTLNRQEAFNRAWNGLKSQGWQCARDDNGTCLYLTADGKRCAWGWVDPTHTPGVSGTLHGLASAGVGVAGKLSRDDTWWARDLQRAHDTAPDRGGLQASMETFAKEHGLTIPETPVEHKLTIPEG